jgi:glycosyltransferase involved in cell wall biosynthesis
MKISLAFTTYNSYSYIMKQLDRDFFTMSEGLIDEIVIQDDCSEDYDLLKPHECENIRLFKNEKNLSPLLSRVNLVNNCKNDWVLLMDSDNFLEKNCFDKIKELELNDEVTYCPDFARPNFGFKVFSNVLMDMEFVKPKIPNLDMQIFLNTGNFLINRNNYLKVAEKIDESFAHWAVDVIYFNYLWLSSGYKLFCIKDYEYDHTLRGDSYWARIGEKSKHKLAEVNELYNKF